jgi:hypothetical protein
MRYRCYRRRAVILAEVRLKSNEETSDGDFCRKNFTLHLGAKTVTASATLQ